MIYKFLLGVAIAFVLASFKLPQINPHLLSALYNLYPGGFQGLVLLLLRISVGGLFLMHGYPKATHIRAWADSLKMPVYMCFVSAWSMLGGGICLIIGLITLLATLPLLASMLFAIFLDVKGGKPFVAQDPYLIPSDQYKGPLGTGEPPSWEKAFMYCVMLITIAIIGPGGYSLDALIFGR